MSLYYSRLSAAANARRLHWLALLCPAASLTAYWPGFYRGLIPPDSGLQAALYYFSYLWAAGYVVLALLLLALELRAIRTPFCRRQFGKTALCLLALSALYLLYCGQDPGQIYRFYSYDYLWIRGAGYLQYTLSVGGYVLLTAGNVICGALALASLLMYTQDTLTARERETGLERRFDVARSGASVFVHSIKNQLLANRVLHKRIRGELQREAPDLEKLRQYVDSLSQNNEQLITRSEELYRTVKSKSVRLFPISLDRLERVALDRFARKHPEGLVESRLDGDIQVLADENYLSEALYNLLANAWEANLEAGRSDRPVLLVCHQERFYTILEVRDQGPGISPAARKHIFEPFYSSKNANFNWGMGLYHTRTIVRSHLGSLRVENNPGGGASFLVVLPRYGG
jgi:signal transduction histidine kinase